RVTRVVVPVESFKDLLNFEVELALDGWENRRLMADERSSRTVRVGLLGCGNVGSALVRLVGENADLITARAGVPIEIARVLVRDAAKQRDVKLASDTF